MPSELEKESMRVRQCASEAGHRKAQTVKSLQSFSKMTQSSKFGEDSPQVNRVSFLDFLPNSIVRSPQRTGTSHSMTT